MKKLILFIAAVYFFSPEVKAQQDPMLTQYMFNGLYLNPAYAGSHKYWTSTLTYRNQWVGIEGAPETAIAAVDGPIPGKNMGLGLILMHDRIGVTRQNTVIANYAYQIKTGEESRLALGINAGISQFSAKLTDLTVWDEDKVFQNDLTSKILPRFGLGAYFYAKKYYVGVSIPTLFAYQKGVDFNFDLSRSSFMRRHYMLTAGYVFDTSKEIKIKPSVLLKYVENAPMELDINLSTVYKDMFWVGASYRTGDAVALILEYQTNSYFRVGYSYDITLSKLRNYSSGSHEIMIGIDFGKDLVKVKTPRYF
jgi:type IX secretion system PorP/SprF family membrane protein